MKDQYLRYIDMCLAVDEASAVVRLVLSPHPFQ